MNNDHMSELLTLIDLTWPRQRRDGWEAPWVFALDDLPFEHARCGLNRLIATAVHPPVPAELRRATAECMGLIPGDPTGVEGEEWAKRARDRIYRNEQIPEKPHPMVWEGIRRFGGIEAVCDDRLAWRRFWEGFREQAIKDTLASRHLERPGLPPASPPTELAP